MPDIEADAQKPASELATKRPGHTHTEHFGKGVMFMMLGSMLFAIADALGKLVTQSYPLTQVVWLRCFFGMALIACVIVFQGKLSDFKTTRKSAHLARSFVGIIMTGSMMTGLKFIPLAEVTAVVFATPLIVAVYSTVIQKEPMNRGMFIAILLGFLGVLVVVRPTPDHFHFAHLVMLGFALSSAYLSITARALIKTESPLTLNFYIYPATIILGGYFAWQDWVTPDLLSLAALFGVAFFATIALLSITKAVHCASPARVTPFDYSRMLWTVSIGLIFWGELPDAITWIGIAVIIFCGLYILRHGRGRQKQA
jgi:drug/metabolite transporter (DMT)-like permease